jgi:hypothetical protein
MLQSFWNTIISSWIFLVSPDKGAPSVMSSCHPYLTNCDFDIHPNDPSDQTAKIQEMLDTAAAECVVAWLRAGVYWVTQLSIPRGCYFRGSGMGGVVNTKGTVLAQFKDFDGSLIVNAPLPTTEWQHWGGVEFMHLYKEPGGTATQGHGIDMSNPVGEDFRPYRLMIENFPQSGIRYRRGGTPVWLNDLHIFRCGEYAIDLEKSGGDRLHCCSIERISGDDNGLGMIHLKTVGDLSEQVSIKHIKAEAHQAGKHPYLFVFEDISQIFIDIEHIGGVVSAAATPTCDALVRIAGNFTGTVDITKAWITGYKSMLRDHRTNADAGEQARNFPMSAVFSSAALRFPPIYGVRT